MNFENNDKLKSLIKIYFFKRYYQIVNKYNKNDNEIEKKSKIIKKRTIDFIF